MDNLIHQSIDWSWKGFEEQLLKYMIRRSTIERTEQSLQSIDDEYYILRDIYIQNIKSITIERWDVLLSNKDNIIYVYNEERKYVPFWFNNKYGPFDQSEIADENFQAWTIGLN